MKNKQIYFLSGLPRSGSTVLAAILNQHPDLHTSATSGLLDMLVGTLRAWADSMSQQSAVDKEASELEIQKILKTIAECKYDYTDKSVILDKARGWADATNIRTMARVLGHKPKIIATVRNIPDCVASMVRVAKPDNLDEFLRSSELVSHVKESYQVLESGYRFAPECILFVDYDDLLNDPKKELSRIHEFLGISEFEYDLDAIDGSSVQERDEEVWEIKGLHEVKPKLERQHTTTAKDILSVFYPQFEQPKFWLNEGPGHRPIHDLDLQLTAGLMGNFEEGWSIAQKIEQDEPWNHRAAFNRGWYQLWKGNLLEGEKLLYRGRIEGVFGDPVPKSPMPIWDGKSKGVVILTLEGGLGDQIHGVRYAKNIIATGCDVIIACSGALAGLFRGIVGIKAVIQHEAIFGVVHDFWVPSMSTAMILGLEYKDVTGEPYINKPVIEKSKKMRIGLRWKGNPDFEHEQHRIFPSGLLFDAVEGVDAEVISLQRDTGADEKPSWVKDVPLDHWEQTAEAIASCDLVITSCTSVAHLSAAMGIDTWIVVPVLPYYLWAPPTDSTVWYDSVTLFRQTSFGDWTSPFKKIGSKLSEIKKQSA